MLSRDEDILKPAEGPAQSGARRGAGDCGRDLGLGAPTGRLQSLVIDSDGNFLGSVSGGCVEGAVVTEAIDVIDSGKPKMLEFGVADQAAWNVGRPAAASASMLKR